MDTSAELPYQEDASGAPVEGTLAVTKPATVHELRPVEGLRYCSSCLTPNHTDDLFCTACGAELELAPTEDGAAAPGSFSTPTVSPGEQPPGEGDSGAEGWPDTPAPHQVGAAAPLPSSPISRASAPAAPTLALSPPARRRSRAAITFASTSLLLLSASVSMAIFLHLELGRSGQHQQELGASQAALGRAESELAETKADLAVKSNESERRRLVLVRAQDVLAKVDALLSSVDAIQSRASDLGAQGAVVASDAEAFTTTVADLVNYMIRTDSAYMDYGYVNSAIDQANSELSTLRSDEYTLSEHSGAYDKASASFGTTASAFTQSVRNLQKQLKKTAGE